MSHESGEKEASLTAFKEFVDAFVDVCHPFLFLGRSRRVNGKRLIRRFDEPAVFTRVLVHNVLQCHTFQWNDVLLVVLLLVDDDVPVNHYVVEQEKLSLFQLLATGLCQYSLSHQDAIRDQEFLPHEQNKVNIRWS